MTAFNEAKAKNKALIIKTEGDTDSIWREVGGERESEAYRMKLLSLTNPYQYTLERNEAMAIVKRETENAYKAAYAQQINGGASKSHAKEFAMKSAMSTKKLQTEAMKMRFPDEDTKTYINKAYKDANAFV
jgi:hypothetical protein